MYVKDRDDPSRLPQIAFLTRWFKEGGERRQVHDQAVAHVFLKRAMPILVPDGKQTAKISPLLQLTDKVSPPEVDIVSMHGELLEPLGNAEFDDEGAGTVPNANGGWRRESVSMAHGYSSRSSSKNFRRKRVWRSPRKRQDEKVLRVSALWCLMCQGYDAATYIEDDNVMPETKPQLHGRADDSSNATALTDLLARKREERMNFLASIRKNETIEECDKDGFFQALLTLAINDYGVSRKSLTALLNVSEGSISKWIKGQHFPQHYVRPQILYFVGQLLEKSLAAEELGLPVQELEPIDGAHDRKIR